jgi:hypothetical protein
VKTPDEFDLLDPETIDDPYPFFASLREHAPIYRVPGTEIPSNDTRISRRI